MIAIILSTFNGKTFITEFLESIIAQTRQSFSLVIRDDGSSDGTNKILIEYQAAYPNIILLQDNLGHIGIRKSYSRLMQYALEENYQYVMFADQDDIWRPEKIEKSINELSKLEKKSASPLLVYTDAMIVDKKLNIISDSFIRLQKFAHPEKLSLKYLLLQSPALGCTMIFNRPLLEIVATIPDTKMIPDKWVLIMAIIYGNVKYLNYCSVLYRQHEQNVSGALAGIKRKFTLRQFLTFIKIRYQESIEQANMLYYSIDTSQKQNKGIIQNYLRIFKGNPLSRFIHYCKFAHMPSHWKRKFGLFTTLFIHFD